MLESNKILITEEDGTETEMEILFTFDDDSRSKSYVLSPIRRMRKARFSPAATPTRAKWNRLRIPRSGA